MTGAQTCPHPQGTRVGREKAPPVISRGWPCARHSPEATGPRAGTPGWEQDTERWAHGGLGLRTPGRGSHGASVLRTATSSAARSSTLPPATRGQTSGPVPGRACDRAPVQVPLGTVSCPLPPGLDECSAEDAAHAACHLAVPRGPPGGRIAASCFFKASVACVRAGRLDRAEDPPPATEWPTPPLGAGWVTLRWPIPGGPLGGLSQSP